MIIEEPILSPIVDRKKYLRHFVKTRLEPSFFSGFVHHGVVRGFSGGAELLVAGREHVDGLPPRRGGHFRRQHEAAPLPGVTMS